MASTIRIKRSLDSGNPSKLAAGELAYSAKPAVGGFAGTGDRLYIGMGTEINGDAVNHVIIGGKYFTDKLDHELGILTANSALLVDSDSKIDQLKTTNLTIGGAGVANTIAASDTNGGITLTPNGTGYVTISGTNGLVIPSGNIAQRAPALAGAIRYNTETDAFEGYNNEGWSSLGGVISTDTFTFIKAEKTTGDGTLYFNAKNAAGDGTVEVAKLDYNGLNIEATTATTSDGTTGALKVAGGAAIQGNLFVGGNLYGITDVSSDAYLAAEGVPNNGTTGYSFTGDGGYDTGMFSTSDGNLRFYSNADAILQLQGTSTATLNVDTLLFGNITSGDRSAAQLGWNGLDNGIKFFTRYGSQETISPLNDGNYLLLQTTNTSGDATAGRSSLRWHDYDVSKYSQVDAQSDGVWIKNADWNGVSTVAQYWHFANDGKLTLPNVANTASQYNSYAQLYQTNNNEITLNPNADSDLARLNIASSLSSGNINLYNNGGKGLTLGNYNDGDSSIDIGGASSSVYTTTADDITISARRSGKINLYTNNNDIVLGNDYGQITFLNSNGHLQIPGVIETTSSTGDVTLVSSDGTDKHAVFQGDGYLTLPNVGIQFKDSNNISGTTKAALAFDGNDIYLDSINGNVSIYANDDSAWTFNHNSGNPYLQLPGGQLSTYNSNVILGNNTQIEVITTETGRVVLGSYSAQQTGQGDYAIAVGYDAGKTNQSNNSIALGYQAAQTSQGYKSVAIGDLAGNDTQGFLSVAIGANAGLTSQANSAVAVGHGAGRVTQGSDATAIGNLAGQTSQGASAVAVGERSGETNQSQHAVAIGSYAGNDSQGLTAVAIGEGSGRTSQGFSAVALGRWAGQTNQGQKAIAIGRLAGGYTGQSGYAIAIGHHAGAGGTTAQGTNAIAIGSHAGEYSQHDNSIVLQATATGDGTGINPTEAGLYIDPIRQVNSGTSYVMYDESTKEVTFNSTNIEISGSTIYSTDVGTNADVILEPLGAGHISASNAQIKHVAEPTDDNDAATKYYVDAARSGLDVKVSVRLATTEDISLTGVQTIDTKTTVTGDRILVKDQDLAKNNGIYIANNSGSWTRATDFDNLANDLTTPLAGEVTGGAFTFVEDGDVNINTGFVLTNKGEPVLGTDALNWTLFSTSGTLIAGDGLSKSGYTLAVNVDANGGIEINSDSLRLKSSLAGDGLTYDTGVLTVGGTADRITVNTHSVDIASTYAGQNSITTLGTIGTGIWNGTAIADTYVANDLTISGGTVDNTPIGSTTRSSGAFTTLAANNLVTFTDTTEAGPLGTGSVVMSGGLSVAKKIYVGGNLTGAGADTSVLSGFDIDGGTY